MPASNASPRNPTALCLLRPAAELNDLLALGVDPLHEEAVVEGLSPGSREAFERLPPAFSRELLIDRDAHGNVQANNIF